ncbi:MAG: hypothetical protein K0R65_572 [Crocinitomicaceae bacterium]|jgi:hypothetical protein|nr:hypothetical protein [Crocinitomicaceae bacterium]
MSVVETEREGFIAEFYDEDTGRIKEDVTDGDFDFAKQGAHVEFLVNEKVRFVTITTPSGRKIVKQIIKK